MATSMDMAKQVLESAAADAGTGLLLTRKSPAFWQLKRSECLEMRVTDGMRSVVVAYIGPDGEHGIAIQSRPEYAGAFSELETSTLAAGATPGFGFWCSFNDLSPLYSAATLAFAAAAKGLR